MHCPFCAHDDTKVNDSRLAAEGAQIRRRRECLQCGERFTTFETAELVMPLVVKNDQRRVPFDENKLRGGMHKALEKRPVSRESVEEAVGHITRKLRSLGEREVTSRQIGEIVMEELHKLDEVAYVRYASVYRHFQDVEAFREEMDRLRHRRGKTPSEDQLSLLPGELLPKKPRQGAQVSFSAFDEAAMRRALELAQRGLYSTHPNPRVGAVLARDEEIVGEGWHERAGEPHAEPHRDPRRGRARARRHRVRDARALQPSRAHAALRGCAARGGRAPRGVCGRRSESARQWRGRARACARRASRSSRACWRREAEALNAGFLMRMRAWPAVHAPEVGGQPRWPHRAGEWREQMDHQRGGARRRAALARAERRGAHQRRHRARRRSAPRRAHRSAAAAAARGARSAPRRCARRRAILAPPGEVLVFAAPTAARKRGPER